MAKQTLPVNFKDDILDPSMSGKRKYRLIDNGDGTVSFEDVTTYTQAGSDFGAGQINATNKAVNESCDKADVIDDLEDVVANQANGKIAGAKSVATLNKYLSELLPKTINASALALLSHWEVMTADVWKEADTVHINMEIYTSAVIQANHMYTINTPASTDPDVRPAKLSFLSAFATDAAYGNTVAVTGMVTPAGAIQISIPNASRPYVFITGEYRTEN